MTSRYKILFSIELLHDYYSTGKCNDFDVSPSAETLTLLKNGQLLFKAIGNKIVILAKVDKTGKPVVNLPSSGKFVFYMGLNRYQFMSVTNLDTSSLGRFYFTNLNQNTSGSTLNITAPVSDYDGAVTYKPGQMADDGTGNIFECIKASIANATSNDSFWASRNKVQYVNENDLLSFKSPVTNFELAVAAKTFEIQVFGLNTTSNLYDKLVLDKVTTADKDKTTTQVQVDMTALPPGKYKVDINGEQFDIYMDNNAVSSNTLGIIEIFTHLPNTNSFALLDAADKVKEFTYTIRFANRRAYWKYMTLRNQVDNLRVTDSMPEIHPFDSYSTDMVGAPTRKDYFLSKQPLLLSEVATLNNFELELVGLFNSTFPAAAKPDPSATGMLTQTDNDFYCTIFLNY